MTKFNTQYNITGNAMNALINALVHCDIREMIKARKMANSAYNRLMKRKNLFKKIEFDNLNSLAQDVMKFGDFVAAYVLLAHKYIPVWSGIKDVNGIQQNKDDPFMKQEIHSNHDIYIFLKEGVSAWKKAVLKDDKHEKRFVYPYVVIDDIKKIKIS